MRMADQTDSNNTTVTQERTAPIIQATPINTTSTEILVIPEQIEDQKTLAVEIPNNDPEVQKLAKDVDVSNQQAIVEFGNQPAAQISRLADTILNSMKVTKIEDSGRMLKNLADLMKRFDRKELEADPGFFEKLFNSAKSAAERILAKYQTIGKEIDSIFTQITQYKKEINDNNVLLEKLFQENLIYYKELEKYIAAGNMVIQEMEAEDLPYWEQKAAQTQDQMDINQLENVRNTIELFKQRVYDLEMAKMVSLQTAPQIRMIQKGNYKLVMKIHSAFVVTIPIFKIGLVQAINLKRQKVVADSMAALDDATNQLLIQNAQNMKQQSIEIAKLAGSSSVKLETVEENWRIIMSGIDETRQIEQENAKNRVDGTNRLHQLQEEYKQKLKAAKM